jgi:L-methionine (R)-S-oxide reductase
MAEDLLDVRSLSKPAAYAEVEAAVASLLANIDDHIAGMATIAAVLHHGFGHLWTGFYRVVDRDRLLRIGPYQGTVGCLDIAIGRGVCGTAARERRTVVVADVGAFPGHIVCDARAKSEIVVPVFDATHELIAVLDVDAAHLAAFDNDDARGLERLVRWFADG